MSNNEPVLSRGSNAAVDCCRHSSLKRMISDKTMICIIHEQQLTSGLLRNIAPMKATFCNTWNMHCIKWISMLKSAFRKYRINTRDKDESQHFTFSKFYAIAH